MDNERVLAVLTHADSAAACLHAADHAAALLGVTRIAVLHVRLDPASTIIVGEEIMTTGQRSRLEARVALESQSLRHLYETWSSERRGRSGDVGGADAVWLEVSGAPERVVGERGRTADLVVVGRPHANADPEGRQVLRAALFDTHRPFLRVAEHLPPTYAQHLAIAWKDSPVARRIVVAALPWLTAARRVSLLRVEEAGTLPDPAWLSELLQARGIDSTIVDIPVGVATVADSLLAAAARLDVDLLVAGAYRHPRIVEFIWGGVTAALLRQATIPLLMLH